MPERSSFVKNRVGAQDDLSLIFINSRCHKDSVGKVPTNPINKDRPEPAFVNLLRSLGIDSQPGGINSWSP
jgi:hypothetical protein